MPVYEFACKSCGHRFSTLCKLGEDASCPKCGGETKKLFSPFAISINNSSEEASSHPSSSPCSTCSLSSCDTCKL